MSADKFKFWVAADIVKGKDKDGKDKMMLKGIASTSDIDSDGETLVAEGFDLSYFKKSGYVNWHHGAKQSPNAVIGEPTKANITKDGLYVECKLYDKPLAREVFELAETLAANSSTRSLGFSIEGKALERDPLNPKRITKAKITGLAVTHMPKNNHTLAEIMKGEVDNSDWVFDENEIRNNLDGLLLKAKDKAKDKVKKDEDEEDEEETEEVETEETEEVEESVEKTLDTASASAIIPESVDGKLKVLTKGDVFKNIFDTFSDIDTAKAIKLYEFIDKTRETMAKGANITEETLEKAYGILGLIKGEDESDKDNKDGSDAINDDDSDKTETDDSDAMNKGEDYMKKMYKGKMEYYEKGGDKFIKKGDKFTKTSDSELEKMCKEMDFDGDDEVKKSEALELMKSLSVDLNEEQGEKIDDLEKAIMEASSEQTELFKAMGTVLKGLKETIDGLAERVDQMETTPNLPKSIQKAHSNNRFQKSNGQNQPANVLSISQNKQAVLSILEQHAFEKGDFNEDFGNAMSLFETSNMIKPHIQAQLAAKGIHLTA